MKNKILIVDDEQDIIAALNMVLEEGGYEVDSFTDPILALKQFKAASYQLVIIDIKMAEMDGFELRRKIKEIDNAVKICFLTASELYYEKIRKGLGLKDYTTLDKDRFLMKPIPNENLIREINMIINSN